MERSASSKKEAGPLKSLKHQRCSEVTPKASGAGTVDRRFFTPTPKKGERCKGEGKQNFQTKEKHQVSRQFQLLYGFLFGVGEAKHFGLQEFSCYRLEEVRPASVDPQVLNIHIYSGCTENRIHAPPF